MIHRTYDKFGNLVSIDDYIHYKTDRHSLLYRVTALDHSREPYYTITATPVSDYVENDCLFAPHEIVQITEQEAMHIILSGVGRLYDGLEY